MPMQTKVSIRADSPKVVFVLGGPGAGKGTQCKLIEDKLEYIHISAGDCLREERNTEGSQLGELIESYIREGRIVPVEITCALLKKKMQKHGWKNGHFLVDGFPRNEDNLRGWHENMQDTIVQFCLYMDCSEEEMKNRLMKRGESSGRSDDNEESILKRFLTYKNETMPIIEWFKKRNLCRTINAAQSIDDVWSDIKECFTTANEGE